MSRGVRGRRQRGRDRRRPRFHQPLRAPGGFAPASGSGRASASAPPAARGGAPVHTSTSRCGYGGGQWTR